MPTVLPGGSDASRRTRGNQTARWENWVFVSAAAEISPPPRSRRDGAVYVFRMVNGSLVPHAPQPKLLPPEPRSGTSGGDRFGSGLDAAGEWLFVASANGQTGQPIGPFFGEVHVYRLDPYDERWELWQTLRSEADPGNAGEPASGRAVRRVSHLHRPDLGLRVAHARAPPGAQRERDRGRDRREGRARQRFRAARLPAGRRRPVAAYGASAPADRCPGRVRRPLRRVLRGRCRLRRRGLLRRDFKLRSVRGRRGKWAP